MNGAELRGFRKIEQSNNQLDLDSLMAAFSEPYVTGMWHASLQGRIYGVFTGIAIKQASAARVKGFW